METLAWTAIALGTISLLRTAIAIPKFSRWLRSGRVHQFEAGATPPLSVLKPLRGDEPNLAENLTTNLRQNYPEFEVIFLHEGEHDAALSAVTAAVSAVPDVPTRVVGGVRAEQGNPKVAALVRGQEEAKHDWLVAADSDVQADPLWLRDVADGLRDADAICFVPVYCGATSLLGRWVSLLKNTEGVLTTLLGAGERLSGSTIAIKRTALDRIGGWAAVRKSMADDAAIGAALYRAGAKLGIARRANRVCIAEIDLPHVMRRVRTLRSASPVAYAMSLVMSLTPLLLLTAAVLAQSPTAQSMALWMLIAHTLIRVAIAVNIDLRFARDGTTVRALPLLPLLWILEPAFAIAGLFGNEVEWRGRRYRLDRGTATLIEA